MANNLIIGLGGTGGNILAELRKRIYSENGQINDPAIDYLYVDSSEEDLNNETKWKYLGTSLALTPAQKVSIHGMSATVLQQTHKYPGIEAFLSEQDRQLMNNDQVMAIISDGIGGQRRRFGRMLMANNIGTPDTDINFVSRLQDKIHNLQGNGDGCINFHICAGLAGGTGSGSFVDVITQINKEMTGLPAENRRIYCYIYIPEVLVNPKHDSGFYHANGYAALCELNAMLIEKYRPTDATGAPDIVTREVQRITSTIDAAYIFSNMNEDSRMLEKGPKLSAAVADFLFQKICGALSGSMVLAENNGASPEKDVAGNNVHARNFLTFGIKRIVYPETEIKEFVTYSYAAQVALQLMYNNWIAGKGYEKTTFEEVGLGYKAELGKKEALEKLHIDDYRLTLQTPIKEIKGVTDNWRSIAAYWDDVTTFFATDATDDGDKRNWPTNYLTSCEMEYQANFRGVGVRRFYETQRQEIKGYAAFLRRKIEEMLFDEWRAGNKSLLEVEKYVKQIINTLPDRTEDFNNRISTNLQYIEQEILPEIADIEREWNNIGWLKDAITGASRKIFDKFRVAKCGYYVAITENESYEFAKLLIQELQGQLVLLQKSIESNRENLEVVLSRVLKDAASKCQIQPASQGKDVNVVDKKYDPKEIRDLVICMMRDETVVPNLTLQVRETISSRLDANNTNFGALANITVDISGLTAMITARCVEAAVNVLRNIGTVDESKKVLNVNILEKIRQQYNTDDLLKQYVKGIVAETKVFTQFNHTEIAQGYNDPTAGASMIRHYTLCLPQFNDPTNFRDRLIQTFAEQCPGFRSNTDVVHSNSESQITFIASVSVIPLRFIQNMKFLEQKYKEVTSGPLGALNKVLLHTESFAKALPPLFEATPFEKEQERRPYAILIHSLGVIEKQTDPETGATLNMLGIGTGFSRQYVKLGKNMEETLQILIQDRVIKTIKNNKEISTTANFVVAEFVDDLLSKNYRTNAAKAELRKMIEDKVCEEILPLCNNNVLDQLFGKYRTAAEQLFLDKLADR